MNYLTVHILINAKLHCVPRKLQSNVGETKQTENALTEKRSVKKTNVNND